MNRLLGAASIFCFCLSAVSLSGCGGSGHSSNAEPSTLVLNTETVFQVGDARRVANTDTRIKLDAVTYDDRCGEGVTCFSGGTASVRLVVSDSTKKEDTVVLPLYPVEAMGAAIAVVPATQTRPAYKVAARDIMPRFGPGTHAKGNTEKYLTQKDYKITFVITQL